MGEQLSGSDGLPARENGEWAERKLEFLDFFGPTAIDATITKVRRVYVDLFAGPGLNIDKGTRKEFASGALRALTMQGKIHTGASFTDAVLVNNDPEDHAALEARIHRMQERGELSLAQDRITLELADANAILPTILGRFHRLDYLLIFADPEAPSQWPWSSVQQLRATGHGSVDLYTLLPLEMGVRRLLDFGGTEADLLRYRAILTAFFGCEDWQPIVRARKTEAQSREMLRKLEDLYVGRLRNGLWQYAERAMAVRHPRGAGLYRMIFASDHEAGKKIATWAKQRAQESDQLRLGPGF